MSVISAPENPGKLWQLRARVCEENMDGNQEHYRHANCQKHPEIILQRLLPT